MPVSSRIRWHRSVNRRIRVQWNRALIRGDRPAVRQVLDHAPNQGSGGDPENAVVFLPGAVVAVRVP